MKFVIIGFATSYKSTVSKHLSQKLNLPLFDVDKLAESQAGMYVSQIFATQGEQAFRSLESKILRDLATQTEGVVSCGGGSVLSADFPLLTKDATVVWLKVNGKSAHKRLNGHTRPLFDKMSIGELTAKIDERNPHYEKYATISLDTSGKTSKLVVAELCALLKI